MFVPLLCFGQESRSLLTNDLNLPSWLTVNAQSRWRVEGQHGLGFVDGNNQDFVLQRSRLSVGIAPRHWVKFFGEVQDARPINTTTVDGTTRDTLDIRQAYVDIGHENQWWDVKIGRQAMAFGSERVIGASDWTNIARVFDAVRLGIHHGANRVDVFSSSVVNADKTAWDHHAQGNDLHGIYASLGSFSKYVKVEPYVLMRTSGAFSTPAAAGHYRSYTYGLRAQGSAQQQWFYEAELLGQHGTIGTSTLSAWGGELQARRQFAHVKWQPSILGEFNYASGDRNVGDGRVNTLDQLYPTNHGIYGFADQVGRRNAENFRTGLWLQPRKWLTLKGEANDFWLASRFDGLYVAGGALSVAPVLTGAQSRHVGQEADAAADIRISKYYSIGMQFGHLFPGQFLNQYANGVGRTFYAAWVDLRI